VSRELEPLESRGCRQPDLLQRLPEC